jgi:hypothetical protein
MAGRLMRRGTNGNDAHHAQMAGCRKVVAKYTFERLLKVPGIAVLGGRELGP